MNVFAIRHGETEWSLSGQHTGTTDIPLTNNGRRLAERIRPMLAKEAFALVLCSPMQRARETCELAGLGDRAVIDADLVEWNYGEYEGLTPKQIHESAPGWLIFRDGCPGGETPEQVGARVDRVIARARAAEGDVALFAHGHILRVLGARVDRAAGRRRTTFPARYRHPVRSWLLPQHTRREDLERTPHLISGQRSTNKLRREDDTMNETNAERLMRQSESKLAISRNQYDAVLLDLDGVITDTASVHAACWKQMFDEYLQKRATQRGEAFRPFDLAADYRLYVDGKPRFDGVRDFLTSRGIQLPEGSPDDSPQAETVGGLGNRKNELVNKVIEDTGVEPYEGSVKLIHQLRRRGFKIAVVTSSQNCAAVLKAAKLDAFFEVRVDGNMILAQRLAGKPAPDTFLMAAKLLGVEPTRAVVIEDALSGVEAGSAGALAL